MLRHAHLSCSFIAQRLTTPCRHPLPTSNTYIPTFHSKNGFLQRHSCPINTWNWTTPKNLVSSVCTQIDPQHQHQTKILNECSTLHSSIMPLNDQYHGPLPKHSDRNTALPFVFLVGNHSSGKSSFVNYVLGRNVQMAGVAPTDDCFTVIAPGEEDIDQDGPALIGDPDIGFSQLRQFGPTLIHHTALKVRSNVNNTGFMMVDSPGMIDSPVSNHNPNTENSPIMDRGYDFPGVVRWFAERADIVLLFFDPDKPGTTGETLSILLSSLSGIDHKLLIVLNKADQFHKIHDFARAYGSLCWNLSKVIPRKDLPKIFTMCLPVDHRQQSRSSSSATTSASTLADLQHTRDDVVTEVMKAPKRRIDNVITHLHSSVHQLLMHARILDDVRTRYRNILWYCYKQQLGIALTGVGVTGSLGFYTSLPMEYTSGIGITSLLSLVLLHSFHRTKLQNLERDLISRHQLALSFQRTHAREVHGADEFTTSIWQRIRKPLELMFANVGLRNVPAMEDGYVEELTLILDEKIPRLRRLASPMQFGVNANASAVSSE